MRLRSLHRALVGGLIGAVCLGLLIDALHLQPWQRALAQQHADQAVVVPSEPVVVPSLDFLMTESAVAHWLSEVVLLAQVLGLEVVAFRPQQPEPEALWLTQQLELQLLGSYWQMADFLERWADQAPWLSVLAIVGESQADGLLLTVQLELWLGEVE
jgi:hypothetical protein